MTEVRFYHLQRKKLEQALPEILAKALERDMRVVVKLGSDDTLQLLDGVLWTHDPQGFLPHGYKKDGFEADHPIWLTTQDDNPNGATVLMLADGATSDKLSDYDLCCDVFDGNDDAAVTAARERWKALKDSGFELSYFQQDDAGRWIKK